MADIIFAHEKMDVYHDLQLLGSYAGKDAKWLDALWLELLENQALYDEFTYYLKHQTLKGSLLAERYSLLDIYVQLLELDNLRKDTGKNTRLCNKYDMILQCFEVMARMQKDPTLIKTIMENHDGMDRM